MTLKELAAHGYMIWKQSNDYLYGWQWKHESGKKGHGYRTRKSAMAAAEKHLERGDEPYEPSMGALGMHLRVGKLAMQINKFTESYIEAALWSSTDDDGNPLDDNYGIDDIADETLLDMIKDAENFQDDEEELLLASKLSDERAGMDFWLTRERHGAGFWDEGLGEIGRKLTDAAHAYGSFPFYVGSDGKVHGQ